MRKSFSTRSRFWTVPVCADGRELLLHIAGKDGKWGYSLPIRVGDAKHFDFVASSPVPAHFEGILQVECEDPAVFELIGFADQPAGEVRFDTPHRQQLHFSPRTGWQNDPNGLVYYQGIYHLFYQHNPFGVNSANQHWGHAVSRDLVHWQDRGAALLPQDGGMPWSGSAVVDHRNLSGLGDQPEFPPILLFFTSSGAGGFTQNVAYSPDGGENFFPYSGNPVLGTIGDGDDRDPALCYDEELDEYLMALFLGEKCCQFALLRSKNLLEWTEFQRFSVPEHGCECPDLFPLCDELSGARRWVFLEANGHYLVGDRDGQGNFLWNYGGDLLHRQANVGPYAGQTFRNAPDGRRFYLAWHLDHVREKHTAQSMTLPIELKLRDGKLLAFPIAELQSLRVETFHFRDFEFHVRKPNPLPTDTDLWEIELTTPDDEEIHLNIGGVPAAFDARRRELRIGASVIGYPEGERAFRGRIFVDRNTIELFDHAGRFWLCVSVDRHSPQALCFGDLWKPNHLPQLTVHRLKSIWPTSAISRDNESATGRAVSEDIH